ncbi:hypothetical protein BD779DRAFT_1673352 [Infundibulicybe gibba]|nr:hypothetical protein BD779DRAFT_1673352 [Infundibulicybe gibba]
MSDITITNARAFGAIEIGVILAALSNGVLALQISQYFHKPGKDPLPLKILIFFVWLATIAHLALGASSLYIITVTNHGTPILEMIFPMSLLAESGLGAFVHSSVQSIYTWRLYKLRGHWLVLTVCWGLSAFVLGSGIAYSVIIPPELAGPFEFNWLFYSHYSAAAGADVLIAAATCWNLIQGRDSRFKKTQQLINRVMLRIVQTGVATSVVAVCLLITFATSQPSTAWFGLYQPLIALYPVTLLALQAQRQGES